MHSPTSTLRPVSACVSHAQFHASCVHGSHTLASYRSRPRVYSPHEDNSTFANGAERSAPRLVRPEKCAQRSALVVPRHQQPTRVTLSESESASSSFPITIAARRAAHTFTCMLITGIIKKREQKQRKSSRKSSRKGSRGSSRVRA